jgi:hypothetical protein
MTMIQFTSLVVGLIGLARLAWLVWRGRRPWWYLAPGIVLLEVVLFYLVVWLWGGFGSPAANAFVSSTIRFQGVSLFVLYLFMAEES